MRERLSDLGFGAGWAVVRWLPEPVARALFAAIADAIWWRRGPAVLRYEANVRPLLPTDRTDRELRQLSRRGLRSYLRYWCEAFRLPSTVGTVDERMVVDDDTPLRAAIATGRGVVCALPHLANWDLAGAWLVGQGHPFTTVAERLRPASLFDRFVAYRQSLGMEVLAAADRGVVGTLADRLTAGRVVCLVADRDLSTRGIEVRLGRGRTRMPAGPAALALRTGAVLLPTTLWYDGPRMHVRFHPPVEPPVALDPRAAVVDMTQRLADAFAVDLAAHVEDWHMLQRYWLDPDPGPEPDPHLDLDSDADAGAAAAAEAAAQGPA